MKDRWLPLASSGEGLFCIGISETEAGSAVNHMRARLTEDGDGFRLNAYKNYVTGGHKSAACLVWCRFPGSEGTKGIGAVVVDLTADGVTIAGTHEKMGLRGTSEAELAFDEVRVEPDDVLLVGDPSNSDSFKTLIGHINHERCGNAAMCVGAAQGALEYAIGYMNERTIGGKPLAALQGLQWKIADMATQLEGARLLLQRALRLAGPHGTPPALETAMAKSAANLAAKFVCDESIQLLGGYGYSREYPVERVYRDIRGLCIGAGTVEIQRNFIGTNLLKGHVPSGQRLARPTQLRWPGSARRTDIRALASTARRAVPGTCQPSTSCSRRTTPTSRLEPSPGSRAACDRGAFGGGMSSPGSCRTRAKPCSSRAPAGASARSPGRSITRPATPRWPGCGASSSRRSSSSGMHPCPTDRRSTRARHARRISRSRCSRADRAAPRKRCCTPTAGWRTRQRP